MGKKYEYGVGFVAVALSALCSPAWAQDARTPEPTSDEIIVTAQKREQALQEVPIAITAFSAQELERTGASTAADLVALSPGLSGGAVASTTPRISVRGISTEDFGVGSDPALGVYVDEVYQGRNLGALSDLFDVARVEVIRGPQGTLFGRNTTAGAISITTNRPSDVLEGGLEVGGEEYGGRMARGFTSGPLSPRWSARGAISYRQRDGWLDNTLGGDFFDLQTVAARTSLAFAGSNVDALFTLEAQEVDNGPQGYRSAVFTPDDIYGAPTSDLGEDGFDRIQKLQAMARFDWRIGELTLTSITSARGSDNEYLEDTDASALKLLHFGTQGEDRAYAQDLRLAGVTSAISWFVGASAYVNDARSTQLANLSEEDWCAVLFGADCLTSVGAAGDLNLVERSIGETETTSYALFGDIEWQASDRLTLTGGLRYAYDEKDFSVDIPANANVLGPLTLAPTAGPQQQSESWDAWQPRLALVYALSDDINFYASASRGYKSGGFNQLNIGAAFDPELLWSYEAGFKGSLFNDQAIFDLAAFHYDYSDLQVLVNEGPSVVTRNAGEAAGDGVEASVRVEPIDGFTISAGAAWLDATYEQFSPSPGTDFAGNRLNRAPQTSASLILDYDRPISAELNLLLRSEYTWQSRVFFGQDNAAFKSQDGYGLLNLRAGLSWAEGDYQLIVFAQNALDEDYLVDAQVVAPGLIEYRQRGAPRIVGVRLAADF